MTKQLNPDSMCVISLIQLTSMEVLDSLSGATLKDLHKAIKLYEEALISTHPTTASPVYKTRLVYVAFLAVGTMSDAVVKFNNNSYYLPVWSVVIFLDFKNVVLNTAKSSYQCERESYPDLQLVQDQRAKGQACLCYFGRYC
ncbi:PREDICTED: beta-galactosidase 8-like isoform X2 [Lupinus angustifolius]|uniref:beta-galactosidase 8-like isoform X2 n=1 Tax=Lupinus angustifolius TaxID=3871 RepID=UPI00092F1799|nr:PREDICTED: beta-galactosidase 8-like isoform X2 [Lupinus angustifolius]